MIMEVLPSKINTGDKKTRLIVDYSMGSGGSLEFRTVIKDQITELDSFLVFDNSFLNLIWLHPLTSML